MSLPPSLLTHPSLADAVSLGRRLNALGYEAALVGGAVRDLLSGRLPKDVDLATNAPVEVMLSALPGARGNPRGLQHGTVIAATTSGEVEVTRYRHDLAADGRYATTRPAGTLEEDLARRDFTINAIAIRLTPDGGALVDPAGGQDDLRSGTLRAVGDAGRRLEEDPLRVLRAYRMQATFGLSTTPDLAAALRVSAPRVSELSGPRRWGEWEKLVRSSGSSLASVLRQMLEDGALHPAWVPTDTPELATLERNIRAIGRLPTGTRPGVALGLLWWGLPLDVLPLARTLGMSERDSDDAVSAVWFAGTRSAFWRDGTPEAVRRLGVEELPRHWDWVDLCHLLQAAHDLPPEDPWAATPDRLAALAALSASTPRHVRDLPIDGASLMAAGVPAGPALGRVQRVLLDMVLANPEYNSSDGMRRALGELGYSEVSVSASSARSRESRPR